MKQVLPKEKSLNLYTAFTKLNGQHDLQKEVPESCVLYKTRFRKGGKLSFFNFDLAKEMGLIPSSHPSQLNANLEKEVLNTFGIVIINEYDIENKKKFPKKDIKENFYMASRYLQLQHNDQIGLNSGDGRSIWNGQISHKGKTWDISSCGTGATRLSPATSTHKKFFQTGDPTISYGCGYAELDEGLGSLLMSEIFHRNNTPTERILAIIEYPGDLAIHVRAYSNLLRPSHFFLHLKQANLKPLEAMTEYYIQRQVKNKLWEKLPEKKADRYKSFLEKVADSFAKTSAQFEDEYIFCWLDWDGDNILMDGGIIDYGSIRQFGLFHHEYRYDDDDRYSTSILEQKYKARYIIQTFAQMVDFLLTNKKKPIKAFAKHPILKFFDDRFRDYKDQNLVHKLGFSNSQKAYLLLEKRKELNEFRKIFSYFEMAKSKKGLEKIADGITCNAIFCMRDILRELPQLLAFKDGFLNPKDFLEVIRSSYATKEDLEDNSYRNTQAMKFQKIYKKFVKYVAKFENKPEEKILLEMMMRTSVINKMDRITGDSISCIVDYMMTKKPRLKPESIYDLCKELAQYQDLNPENIKEKSLNKKPKHQLMRWVHEVVKDLREGI